VSVIAIIWNEDQNMTTMSTLLVSMSLAMSAASASAQTPAGSEVMGGMHHPASAAAGMMKQGEPMRMKKPMMEREKKMKKEGMMNKDAASSSPKGQGSQ
jgi:hypothetical protein